MKKWIMLLLFGLLFAGCVGSPLPPAPAMNFTQTWTPTATMTATYTPSPTVDLLATLTYTEPIGPTFTPTPTEEACNQEELNAFRSEANRIRDRFIAEFNRARELQQEIVSSGLPGFSQAVELSNIYFEMAGLAAEAEQLDYPPCAEGARSKLIESFNNYTGAVQEIVNYYSGTGGDLDAAEEMIAAGERLLKEAFDELDALAS